MRDIELGSPGSRTLGMVAFALAILLYTDFKNFPDKGLSAFMVEDARFPESFKEKATRLIKFGTVASFGLFFVALMDSKPVKSVIFSKERYLEPFRQTRTVFQGNLWFGYLVIQAALCCYALLVFLSDRFIHIRQLQNLSLPSRQVAKFGWIAFFALVILGPPLLLLARDAARWLMGKLPFSRAGLATASLSAFGIVMSLVYYPALASQISPKEVFDSYRKLAKKGELLALSGVGAGSATYYAKRDVPSHNNPTAAFQWLVGSEDRRWLVVRASELPKINSLFRARAEPRKNVPVLDARSSEILLLSNRLGSDEENQNPFAEWFPDQAPKPTRPLPHVLGDQLRVIGWDVTTVDGNAVAAVVPGKRYHFRIYYRVLSAISGNWETFIHIDGFRRRYNGDHKTLEGRYPFHLWAVGDHVVDVHPFRLEPNFTPGEYSVFFGLFIGNRRLEVKTGRHHENRIRGGELRVK